MITGYHHTQISVPSGSADEVRRFYGQVLGLAEMDVPPALHGHGLIWFKVGDRSLHVGVEDGVNRLATRTHLAYEVDDIAAIRRRLSEQGIQLIDQPKIGGWDRFHIHDPFGNRLEIIGRDTTPARPA
jgi:catechol 2,3-dioxygenase-like lactoylglutathione lyase family enzyme